MRLINVDTFEMKEIADNDIEIYAILSHTWEEEEVTFKDYCSAVLSKFSGADTNQQGNGEPHPNISGSLSSMKGFNKLVQWCSQARDEGFEWAWMDTCCIDKSSSAELSEAINAMFSWYSEAGVCYAYLSDVNSDEDPSLDGSSFRTSRWFTRGWTLQELIAPTELIFLASDWEEIGTRRSLSETVSSITGIDETVLHDSHARHDFSLAQRMSWASERQTTRIEDQAYCLLGIFDVNMPLLYGERDRAFGRLQAMILSGTDDCSLLAWESLWYDSETGKLAPRGSHYSPHEYKHKIHQSGFLATSASAFKYSGHIKKLPKDMFGQEPANDMVRHGISMKVSGQWLKLMVPVFGPMHSDGAHRGGLARVLSPELSERILKKCWWYRGTPGAQPIAFGEYIKVRRPSAVPWKDIAIIFVGMVDPTRDNNLPPRVWLGAPDPRPEDHYFIGILLNRGSGSNLRRVHWPPLIVLDRTYESQSDPTILSWPLTRVHAPVIDSTDIDRERNWIPILKTIPCNFVLVKDLREEVGSDISTESRPYDFDELDFVYTAKRVSRRVQQVLPTRITFFPGESNLPTFRLHFKQRHRKSNNSPWTWVALVLQADIDVVDSCGFFDGEESSWRRLDFEEKTSLELTITKAVTVKRRPASEDLFELYDVIIEDIQPAQFPPLPSSETLSASRDDLIELQLEAANTQFPDMPYPSFP